MTTSRWLVLILILGAVLRLWGLGSESLWLDEALTLEKVEFSWPVFVRHFAHETQTILYYSIEKVWCALAGTGEGAVRFPSVVFGLAAVFSMFLLGAELFSPTAGLFAAAFMAVNPFAIYYSQDARPYALFLAAAIFSVYSACRLMRKKTRAAQAGYVLSTAAALYSQPLAPLLLGVHVGSWFVLRRGVAEPRRTWRALTKGMGLSLFLFVPQILLIARQAVAKTQGRSAASWIPRPLPADFAETVRQYFMHPLAAVAFVLMIIVAVAVVVWKSRRLPSPLWIPVLLIVFCMMAPWIVSWVITPVYVARYTIPALAGFLLLGGWALAEMSVRLRIPVLCGLLALNGLALHGYYTGMDKDPWREAAAVVQNLAKPGDLVVVMASYTRPALLYYYDLPKGVAVSAPWSRADFPAALDSAGRIVLVSSYVLNPNPDTRDLVARVQLGREIVHDEIVAHNRKRNPHRYWLAEIRVTAYERIPEGLRQEQW